METTGPLTPLVFNAPYTPVHHEPPPASLVLALCWRGGGPWKGEVGFSTSSLSTWGRLAFTLLKEKHGSWRRAEGCPRAVGAGGGGKEPPTGDRATRRGSALAVQLRTYCLLKPGTPLQKNTTARAKLFGVEIEAARRLSLKAISFEGAQPVQRRTREFNEAYRNGTPIPSTPLPMRGRRLRSKTPPKTKSKHSRREKGVLRNQVAQDNTVIIADELLELLMR